MSNFDLNTVQKLDQTLLNFDYSLGIDMYKLGSSGGITKAPTDIPTLFYYSIPYVNNQPNLTYSNNGKLISYNAKTIYLFGLVHNNITGVTDNTSTAYNGEIIIEHIGNDGSTAYTCFFVNKAPINGPDNNVDKIIKLTNFDTSKPAADATNPEMLRSVKLTKDEPLTIPNQRDKGCIIYDNTTTDITAPKKKIFIFLNPILVNNATANSFSSLSTKLPTGMFSINAPLKQQMTNSVNVVSSGGDGGTGAAGISNNEDNEIYIDCNLTNPIDASGNVEGGDINTYNIPIDSYLTGQQKQLDLMKTSTDLFLFIIGAIVAYFAIPALYKKMIIDYINKESRKNGDVTNTLTRIRSADIAILLLFITAGVVMLSLGGVNNDHGLIIGGSFLLIFLFLATTLIQSKKTDDNYMKTMLKDCGTLIGKSYGEVHTDIIDVFKLLTFIPFIFFINNCVNMYFVFFIITVIIMVIITAATPGSDWNKMGIDVGIAAGALVPGTMILKLLIS